MTQRDNAGNSNNVDGYPRRLALAEDTVEQKRTQHEEDLTNVKFANIKRITLATEKQQEEIQQFSLKVSKACNDYQTKLLEKYTEKYGQNLEKSVKLQQQLQQQVIEFGYAERKRLRAQEFKEEQDNIFFIKNAKLQADLEVFNTRIEQTKKQQQLEFDAINKKKKAKIELAKFDQNQKDQQRQIDYEYKNVDKINYVQDENSKVNIDKSQAELNYQVENIASENALSKDKQQVELINRKKQLNYDVLNQEKQGQLELANKDVELAKNQKQLNYDVLNQKKQAALDAYNQDIQLQKSQAQLDADARILAIKQASTQEGYADAEAHQSRIQTYTDELKTRLNIIDNERKQDLAGVQQSKKARLVAWANVAVAQAELTAAQQSGDSEGIKAAEEKLEKAQAEKELKDKEYKDAKKRAKDNKKDNKKETKQVQKDTAKRLREEGATELEVMAATKKFSLAGVKEAVFSKETASTVANTLINGVKEMFESTISTYGQYQSKINTRLQGSGTQWNGSNGIEKKITGAVGSNPYVKLQAVMDNVVKATEQGIAYNIEQRAFLATVSENIASTFDAFNSNLARVIRLQQSDTTAARLGLEANLTSLFNSLYQDTSYLNDSFDSVSQNLTEAISQMNSEEGVAFEYTVQKWLGALSSVGFSSDAVTKISQAIGYLGSGDITSLSNNSEMQNLIVMAASRVGMSYADMLTEGLDSSNTNKLMKSMVEYLQEIANSDNKVVKSQYAQIFGMSVSDLKAVNNLSTTVQTISNTMLDYGGAMQELYSQMGELSSRVSVSGMLNNMMDNVKYSIGTSIASNPVTYALWEVTSLIEDLTGGINLPTISAFGNSVDLNTTVTNLMRLGVVGAGTLSNIGTIISSVGNGIVSAFNPSNMLSQLGIENSTTASKTQLARGAGVNRKIRQLNQISSSTMVGNASGEDYYESTVASANEQTKTTAEAAKEESTDKTTNDIYDYLVTIFDPKFTEIEKMMSIMNNYKVNDETVKLDNDDKYKVTNVSISYPDMDNNKTVNATSLLNTINDNVSQILTHVVSIDNKALDNSILSPSSVI